MKSIHRKSVVSARCRRSKPGRLLGFTLAATALFRAAEVAMTRLEQPARAVAFLERLLREQPQSQWHALAERMLRQLRPAPAEEDEGRAP